LSPMNATNNINDIGKLKREEVYTLKDKKLQAVQDAMVRKIVKELKDYDNLYYEICNEPYFGGVTLTWQAHIAGVIVETEKEFKHKHLIAQNIANKGKKIEKPNPHVSIFNFHYAKPPFTVYDNFHLNRPLGDDETGFAGSRPEAYRREGWDFMLAGGAVFDNLDYSFNVGHEDGTAQVKAPGSVGREMHRQLKVLKQFMESLDFIHMRPDNAIIKSKLPSKTTARALVNPNREIAVYINGPGVKELILEIPKGTYRAKWLDPVMGRTVKQQSLKHSGGSAQLGVPSYGIDLALHLVSDAVSRKDSISR